MKTLVLASGSPARKDILDATGVDYIIDVSNYEEDMSLAMSPLDLAVFLSKNKAKDVAKRHNNAVILAADSFGVFKDELLGKPHTLERAKEMLTLLSGNVHSFVTGFTIIDCDTQKEYSGSAVTKVYFKRLTPEQIDDYLSKEDVLLKAGAYTIQGLGKDLIDHIEGDYDNVCGLPLGDVADAIKGFGIELPQSK